MANNDMVCGGSDEDQYDAILDFLVGGGNAGNENDEDRRFLEQVKKAIGIQPPKTITIVCNKPTNKENDDDEDICCGDDENDTITSDLGDESVVMNVGFKTAGEASSAPPPPPPTPPPAMDEIHQHDDSFSQDDDDDDRFELQLVATTSTSSCTSKSSSWSTTSWHICSSIIIIPLFQLGLTTIRMCLHLLFVMVPTREAADAMTTLLDNVEIIDDTIKCTTDGKLAFDTQQVNKHEEEKEELHQVIQSLYKQCRLKDDLIEKEQKLRESRERNIFTLAKELVDNKKELEDSKDTIECQSQRIDQLKEALQNQGQPTTVSLIESDYDRDSDTKMSSGDDEQGGKVRSVHEEQSVHENKKELPKETTARPTRKKKIFHKWWQKQRKNTKAYPVVRF